MSNKMIKWAKFYRDKMGFSVIPADGKDIHLLNTWSQYKERFPTDEEIEEWFTKYPNANLAIVCGKLSNLTVVDLDIYDMSEEQKALLPQILPKYATATSKSPSGGEHRFFTYTEGLQNWINKEWHIDVKTEGGAIIAPPSVNGSKYIWDDTYKLDLVGVSIMPENYKKNIIALYNKNYSINNNSFYIGDEDKPVMSTTSSPSTMSTFSMGFDQGGRDDTLFHVANCLVRGGMDAENIQEFLSLVNSKICNPPLSERDVRTKVQSALKRSNTQNSNFTQEVRDLICLQSGIITSTFVQQCLHLTTRNEKKKLSTVLRRLELDGLIEKTGVRGGEYRIIQVSEFENWWDADQEPIQINLPFGMNDYVDIYPGDLIVIAGVKNSGKTALALNFIELNLDKDCYYHSSELVKQTFKLRVSKSKRPISDWKNVKMTSGLSMSNAKDRVVSNALNVFDYIEGDEGEFYKIPATMARIHRALGDGVGIVCLQKPAERSFARGGEGTKDKASLYLTIDKEFPYHVCRIGECKTFKDELNPTGYMIKYKVGGGINLKQEGVLQPE